MRREVPICFALAALTLGVYWPVRHHDFILYDDPSFIAQNPQIQSGLNYRTIAYAFTTAVCGNWHPVTTLSHALDCELFGTSAGPQHLVSVAIHAVNAVLLFALVLRLTGALWPAAIVAALFALHPLRVESVAWIAERKDVLSGFFFLLTLLAYGKYVQSPKSKVQSQEGEVRSPKSKAQSPTPRASSNWKLEIGNWKSTWYLLSLLLFALGLMSKPMLVTLPFLLLLLDYWPLHRLRFPVQSSKFDAQGSTVQGSTLQGSTLAPLLFEKLPFFALSGLCSWLTMRIQEGAYFVRTRAEIPFSERLTNAVASYYEYLAKTLLPTKLAVLYPHPGFHYPVRDVWPVWEICTAGLLLLAISALCLLELRRRPWLAVGWFWYLGMLVPVIGLVQVGDQAMADRYTYLPLIGPVLALVWELSRFGRQGYVWIGTLAMASIVACALVTRHQLAYWHDTVTLFEHTVAITPDNPSAEDNLACGLLDQGRAAEAAVRFRVTLAIEPDLPQAHYALGELLRQREHWQQAAGQFQAAINVATNGYLAYVGLAAVLPHLDRNREAEACMDRAIQLNPSPPPEVLNDLAWALATSPQPEKRDGPAAVRFAERACQLTGYGKPLLVGTLAAAYAEAGRFAEAVTTAELASRLASEAGDETLGQINRRLLELYREDRAWHGEASDAPANPEHR